MALALAAAAAGISGFAAADGDPPSSKADATHVSALAKPALLQPADKSAQRKKPEPQDDAKDNWPTDDFGRPLRGCDVPWDFVPAK